MLETHVPVVGLPKTVRISAFDFTIEKWCPVEATISNVYGDCSTLKLRIRIEKSLHPVKMMDTFIHEINHAIYWAYKLQDSDKEERIVSTMATAWAQVYRDNPTVLEFLAWASSRERNLT